MSNTYTAGKVLVVLGPIRKETIYKDARLLLHKFGEAMLTDENYKEVNIIEAKDIPQDVRLFEMSFEKYFNEIESKSIAYMQDVVDNTTEEYYKYRGEDAPETLPTIATEYEIILKMPSTWIDRLKKQTINLAENFITNAIASDFLKDCGNEQYQVYMANAIEALNSFKHNLTMRKAGTKFIEIKPW